MSSAPAEKQPLINQKATIRFAIGLLVIAGLIFGYQMWLTRGKDIEGTGEINTAGSLAAVEHLENGGSQIVVFGADGKVVRSPGYSPGTVEREFVWRPDGNQIFFSSDRDRRAFNIYRWNLARGKVLAMSQGTLGRSAPSFSPKPLEDGAWPVLIVAGGSAWDLDPAEQTSHKVMPYEGGQEQSASDEEKSGDGTGGEVGAGRYRIKKTMWGKDRQWLIGVRRTETGEALIMQPATGDVKSRVPIGLVFGDHVDFDIRPDTGEIVYCVQGFQWPDPEHPPEQFIKDGKAVKPYLHGVGIFNPTDLQNSPALPVTASLSDKTAFTSLKISPDGASLLLTVGPYVDGSVNAKELYVLPVRSEAIADRQLVSKGEIYEPSWHPNNGTIAFIRREGGKRHLYTVEKDGTGEKRISDGQKSYAFPQFSPQTK
jgi:Tol biopolymer transport system component